MNKTKISFELMDKSLIRSDINSLTEGIPTMIQFIDENDRTYAVKGIVDIYDIMNSLHDLVSIYPRCSSTKVILPLDINTHKNVFRLEILWLNDSQLFIALYPPSFEYRCGDYINVQKETIENINKNVEKSLNIKRTDPQEYAFLEHWLMGENPRCNWKALIPSSNQFPISVAFEPKPASIKIPFFDYYQALIQFSNELMSAVNDPTNYFINIQNHLRSIDILIKEKKIKSS